MKKIIAIIALAFMAITASAQISYGYTELRVGEYFFRGVLPHKGVANVFVYDTDFKEEAQTLYKFIKTNKAELEKKYDMVICGVFFENKVNHYQVSITAQTGDDYRMELAIKAQREKEKKEAEKAALAKLKSLDKVL